MSETMKPRETFSPAGDAVRVGRVSVGMKLFLEGLGDDKRCWCRRRAGRFP